MILDPHASLPTLAALAAAGQLALARWRDLGPLTVTLVATAMLTGAPSHDGAAWLTAAAVVAAAGWWRAARHGVGRADAVGMALAGAVVGGLARIWVPAASGADPGRISEAVVPACVLVGLVATVLAIERPGPRRQRVWHHREVPVTSAPTSGEPR